MINCIVIDDEALAIDLLEDYISRVPFLSLVGKFTRATDSMELIRNGNVDLIFLDIHMPDITGIQFLKALGAESMIIFSTAYPNYALEGFNLKILDYLLKPFHFDRFVQAVSKAQELHSLKSKPIVPANDNDYIFVNSEHNLVRINFIDISYIEGLKDYIKIHLKSSQKPVVTRMPMKIIEEQLPASAFLRIHKSYIISIAFVTAARKSSVLLGAIELPVSDNYRDAINQLTGRPPATPIP